MFALGIHDDIKETKSESEQTFPGELNWTVFFPDDGTAAGTICAVSFFTGRLSHKMAQKGLETNLGKLEVVPAAGVQSELRPEHFPGMGIKWDGNFKLLGAPLGSGELCSNLIKTNRKNA